MTVKFRKQISPRDRYCEKAFSADEAIFIARTTNSVDYFLETSGFYFSITTFLKSVNGSSVQDLYGKVNTETSAI